MTKKHHIIKKQICKVCILHAHLTLLFLLCSCPGNNRAEHNNITVVNPEAWFLSKLDSLFFNKVKPYGEICETEDSCMKYFYLSSGEAKDGYDVYCSMESRFPETATAAFIHRGYTCFVFGKFPCKMNPTGERLIIPSVAENLQDMDRWTNVKLRYSCEDSVIQVIGVPNIDTQLREIHDLNPNPIYNLCLVDEAPVFSGGKTALVEFLHDSIGSRICGEDGIVSVHLVINEDGVVSTERSYVASTSEDDARGFEAVFRAMPRWKAAVRDGADVRVTMNIDITPSEICLQ